MKYPGFIGGSYQSQSGIADAERSVNWYVEQLESPNATAKFALYPTPGFLPFVQVPQVGTRALFSENGRAFGVVGTRFYEIFANQSTTERGIVEQDANLATICSNGAAGGQLLVTSGNNAYAYDLAANTLTQVLTDEATMGGFLDGYGLVFNQVTGRVRLSGLNNLTTWDPTQFFANSITPDPWRAMQVDRNRQVWMIGEKTGQVWYDSGASPQPFAPVPGAVFGSGIASTFAIGLAGTNVIWLEQNDEGAGRVVAARGYLPQPISDYSVDTAIGGYARTAGIADAEQLVYQADGHTFFNLSFVRANATQSFDVDRPSWHERGAWNAPLNRFDVWRPRVHAYAFGLHLVGDRMTGTIAMMTNASGVEADGTVLRRLRRAPGLLNEYHRLRYDRIELLIENGVGLATGQGSDPKVMLRMSDDGGRAWGSERQAGIGRMGQYRHHAYWTRNGVSEDCVLEVSISDPVPARILGAFINNTADEIRRAA